MRPDHVSHYLHLLLLDRIVGVVHLDVGLERLLNQNLLVVFNFHDNLKRKLFQGRNFIPEIAGMLINRDPDANRMSLNKAIELIDIQAIIDVSLQSHDVLHTSILIPIMDLVIEPSILFQQHESLLAPQEFGDEDIHVI